MIDKQMHLGFKRSENGLMAPTYMDPKDLRTHAMVLGMTGSGKTGLVFALAEELIESDVPIIVIDQKGDLARLLRLPEKHPQFAFEYGYSILTPGQMLSPVSLLGSFSKPDGKWEEKSHAIACSVLSLCAKVADRETCEAYIAAAVEYLWINRFEVTLASIAEVALGDKLLYVGRNLSERFITPVRRKSLGRMIAAVDMHPKYRAWKSGSPLDFDLMFWSMDGKPKCTVLTLAGLDGEARDFFMETFLSSLEEWMLKQPGVDHLRCAVVIDEAHNVVPPVRSTLAKKKAMSILKQARAFGLGMLLCTQNPADIDYKAISNVGTWFIGRLNTAQDRDRLLGGMSWDSAADRAEVNRSIASLESREFVRVSSRNQDRPTFKVRDVYSPIGGPLGPEDLRALALEYGTPPASSQARTEPSPVFPLHATPRTTIRRARKPRVQGKPARGLTPLRSAILLACLFGTVTAGNRSALIFLGLGVACLYIWAGGPVSRRR